MIITFKSGTFAASIERSIRQAWHSGMTRNTAAKAMNPGGHPKRHSLISQIIRPSEPFEKRSGVLRPFFNILPRRTGIGWVVLSQSRHEGKP
jgi:hypothetical protein